jgi:Zn finger protein HypA/HybF involved in hydrogenase expression
MSIEDKVKELESLAKWVKIYIIPIEVGNLSNIEIHLHSALFNQILKVDVVDADEWLDNEITVRKERNQNAYAINCFQCGTVMLGWDEYNRQMNNADSFWMCPICGNEAEFDVDIYESVFYPDPTASAYENVEVKGE